MPRGSRLDAPGSLQNVMGRGMEGRAIFRDDRDRVEFLRRVAALVQAKAFLVYAWALPFNHFHLLVRSGQRPLPSAMRALLAGYAGYFNRRHRRNGHLFQNRYKSIVVEEEPYFLELVRYLHLNPVRAGVIRDVRALDRYPWTGHAVLMGHRSAPWQDTDAVLALFGATRSRARQRYRTFVAEGVARGHRSELQGGGLVRSAGGWEAVRELRRGRERWAADERILGSSAFVETVRQDAAPPAGSRARAEARAALPRVLDRCASLWGVAVAELRGGSRRRAVAEARATASWLAVRKLGLPIVEVARELGVSEAAVRRGLGRGEAAVAARGDPLMKVVASRRGK